MKAAQGPMVDDHVDFGLLFCEQHNEKFYTGLGWKTFDGETYCEQPSGRALFDVMAAMILSGQDMRPSYTIDLCGLPW